MSYATASISKLLCCDRSSKSRTTLNYFFDNVDRLHSAYSLDRRKRKNNTTSHISYRRDFFQKLKKLKVSVSAVLMKIDL